MNRPTHDWNQWVLQAEADLGAAAENRDGGRHNLACFLAHQAAEKALKAHSYFLASTGDLTMTVVTTGMSKKQFKRVLDAPFWGHSLADLCRFAADNDFAFQELVPIATVLDNYYELTRYPSEVRPGIPAEAYTQGEADLAISFAQRILDAVRAKTTPTGTG